MKRSIAILTLLLATTVSGQNATGNTLVDGRCSVCVREGKRSVVTSEGGCYSTLAAAIAYFDEAGKYHYSDPNTTTCGYRCSLGHVLVTQTGGARGATNGLVVEGVTWLTAQPATIPAPTGPLTVTVTLSAADALLVHAVVAPPNTPIPLDAKGQPSYATLEGAIQAQFAAVVKGWIDVGARQQIDADAADILALDPADRAAVKAEIEKRRKRKPSKEKR